MDINKIGTIDPYLKEVRRQLHQIPELAFQEEKTIAYLKAKILDIIEKSNRNITLKEMMGGLVVDLLIDPSYKRLLFRADIDALPITEETGLIFSSKHPGKMHACGHDIHAAMLLGALKCFSEENTMSAYNLRFVFQRSEERKVDGISGGQMLVNEGVLDSVDEVYALHIFPRGEVGHFFSRSGVMMADTSQFHIEINSTGGHVARPYDRTNAIDVLIEIQNSSRGFLERFLHPSEEAILVPSIIEAGNIPNVRPSKGKCCFVLRHFLCQERAFEFQNLYTQKIQAILDSYPDCKGSTVTYIQGYPLLKNSPSSFDKVKKRLEENAISVTEGAKSYGGEDFAYFLQQKPGAMWYLGVNGYGGYDLHTSKMNPDEGAMIHGVLFWLLLATLP